MRHAAQDSHGQAYNQSTVIERASPLRYCRNGLPIKHEIFGFVQSALELPGSAHKGDAAQVCDSFADQWQGASS